MSRNSKIISAVVFGLVVLVGAAWFLTVNSTNGVAADNDQTTVAVVNGAEITRADVKEVVSALPNAGQVSVEQVYPMIVDQLINDALLEARVESSGTAADPEVEKRLDKVRDQIARSLYVERYVEKQVTDEKIKEEYQKLKKASEGVKEVHARHILVPTEEKAREMIAELEGGADFATLAKEHSTGPAGARGGDLGYFTEDAMVPEFSKVAFSTPEGTYAPEPVKTQFGWHVIYVEDIRDRQVPELAKVEPMIRRQLGQKAVEQLVNELREGAEVKTYDWDGNPRKVN